MSPDIIYEKKDHIATITLNRPHALNALTREMMDVTLPEIWQDIKKDKQVWVVIFTAAGDRSFSSGRDLREAAKQPTHGPPGGSQNLKMSARQNDIEQPVICAVNGVCTGGAFQFVSDADIVICSENATFVNTAVSVGHVVTYSAIQMTRYVPFGALNRMLMVGAHERVSAQRAYELGIVTEVVPYAKLMDSALDLARKIAKNSPTAVRIVKKTLTRAMLAGLDESFEYGRQLSGTMSKHPDIREGTLAFVEKREPRWNTDGL